MRHGGSIPIQNLGELDINVLAMGLNPSPSGEAFRFFALLEFGGGKVPNEFAQPL